MSDSLQSIQERIADLQKRIDKRQRRSERFAIFMIIWNFTLAALAIAALIMRLSGGQ